jgi:hypothetical protein
MEPHIVMCAVIFFDTDRGVMKISEVVDFPDDETAASQSY